jgi:hypothetical protein
LTTLYDSVNCVVNFKNTNDVCFISQSKNHKTKLLLIVNLFLCLFSIGQTFTWTGNSSDNWNDSSNWSPTGIPNTNSHSVIISNPTPSFPCRLSQNTSLYNLTVRSNAQLYLNLFNVSLANNLILNKAHIYDSGSIIAENIAIQKTIFYHPIKLVKYGGTTNDCEGANVFMNTAYIHNRSNSRIRMANSFADTFKGAAYLKKHKTGNIEMAYNGYNLFYKFISLHSDTSGTISFGNDLSGSGTSHLINFFGIRSDTFSKGNIYLYHFKQWNACPNQLINPTNCLFKYTQLKGRTYWNVQNDITISYSSLSNNNSIICGNDLLIKEYNRFSTDSGTTTFTKNGGGIDDWVGGNTFGNLVIHHNDNSRLRMASTLGDTFKGNTLFIKKSTGTLEPSYNNHNFFYKDLSTIGSNSTINFGLGTGTVVFRSSDSMSVKSDSLSYPNISRLTINTIKRDAIYLNTKLIITNQLLFINGIINTSSRNNIVLNNETVSSNIGSDSAFINGPMDYEFTSNSNTMSNLNFPLGKKKWNNQNLKYDYEWRPITLNVAHTSNTSYTYRAEMQVLNGRSIGWQLPSDVDTASNIRLWTVQRFLSSSMLHSNSQLRTTSGAHPRITLYFDTSDGVFDGNNLCVLKNKTFAPTSWFNIGSNNTPSYLNGRPLKGSITSTSDSFNSFGSFTLGSLLSGYNPLPIKQTTFKAIPFYEFVKLEWKSNHNQDLASFIIEKSSNRFYWNKIGEIAAHHSSLRFSNYEYIDSTPIPTKTYYRLSKKYNDGLIKTECTIEYIPFQRIKFILYPNPSSQWCYIKALTNIELIKQINVYDMGGKKIDVLIKEINKNESRMNVTNLKRGLYKLQIETNQGFENMILKID